MCTTTESKTPGGKHTVVNKDLKEKKKKPKLFSFIINYQCNRIHKKIVRSFFYVLVGEPGYSFSLFCGNFLIVLGNPCSEFEFSS